MVHAAMLVVMVLFCGFAAAADAQWVAIVGHGLEASDTDIVRLGYRLPLRETDKWWMPTHAQLAGSVWRVPDIAGTTRRFDLSASAIWRAARRWGYAEAGFGPYLLSKTINNADTRMPSSLEFGTHLGLGFDLGTHSSLGIAVQHLSNGGIKQPNGGINLLLVQYTYAAR
jgi:hypothetical protein